MSGEQRTYQYRVWEISQARWVRPDDISLAPDGTLYGLNLGEYWRLEPQDDYLIEYATGEEDKTGKMIFEGDIIHDQGREINKKGETILYTRDIEVRFPQFWIDVHVWLNGEEFEIVGNVHEHPDLLEKFR